ncbi:MAG: hypothetical protein R2795_03000 [Saprospiraceae bacterium]
MKQDNNRQLPPSLIEQLEDWPIYQLSEDRERFLQEIEAYTLDLLSDKPVSFTNDLISKTIYKERIRVKEDPWKVDPPKEKQFWRRLSQQHVRQSLDGDPQKAATANREILAQMIRRYADEIVGTFSIATFLFARRFLTFFFTRLLNAAALRSIKGLWGSKHRLADK